MWVVICFIVRPHPDNHIATGTEEEVLAAFRAARDDIAKKSPALLKQHE